uniref:Uncharacterized protein n=1 Tax=Plectus sambesii TaxID=2011161 RepID=A0A914WJG3_9BILA
MGSGSSRQQEERALSPFGVQDGVEPWIPPDSRLSGSIDGYGFGNSTITHTTESIPKRHSRNRSDPGYHTDVMSSSNSNSTGSDKKKQVINITIDMNKINRRFSSAEEEHEAATKIQAHFRGFLARKRLQKNDPPKRRKQKNHEKLDVDSSARGTSRSLTLSNNSDEQKKPKRSKSKAKNDAVVRRSRSDTNLEEKNRQQSKARSKSKSKPPALLERSSGANSKNSKSVASSVPSKNTSRPPGKEIRVVAPKGKEGIAPRS